MPFLALHHAKVLVEGELAHRVKCEPVHDLIDHNRLFRGRQISDVVNKNSDLSVDAISI